MTLKVTMTFALTYFITSKVMVSFMVGLTLFMTQKGDSVLRGRCDLLYDPLYDPKVHGEFGFMPQKVTGSLEVIVTYFMTLRVMVTFMVSLT